MSFVVYAIFAYAGLESLGGMIDSIDQPEKTFPKGLLISSLLIAAAYSLMGITSLVFGPLSAQSSLAV